MKTYLDETSPNQIVAARRREIAMTQAELAKKLGFSGPNFISILEADRSKVPLERAVDFSKALDMDPLWFIEKILRERFPPIAEEIFDRHEFKSSKAA